MPSDFERILQKFGGKENYLAWTKTQEGRLLVTAQIQPALLSYPGNVASDTEVERAIQVLHQDDVYTSLLADAVTSCSFDQARQYINNALGIQNPRPESTQVLEGQGNTSLNHSFEWLHLSGTPVDGLDEYLSSCNASFRQGAYYGRFCLALQSSGTGKTHTIVKFLREKVLGLYINVRPQRFTDALPSRDDIPADILDRYTKSEEEYTEICVAFFTAVFSSLRNDLELNGMTDKSDKAQFIAWSKAMNHPRAPDRKRFFQNLENEHDRALEAIRLGGRRDWPFAGDQAMWKAHQDLVESFPSFFDPESDNPKLVIVIDSARGLGTLDRGYRRSQVLCRVISRISDCTKLSNWVVFVASGTSVADFLTPTQSVRFERSDPKLFPPYSQFGWDHLAKPLLEIEPGKVALFNNIVGFGRPLWKTLIDESYSQGTVFATIRAKLCLSEKFETNNIGQVIAVLGQRFCLDFRFGHPDSIKHQIKAISNHLRVCLDTTNDGLWHTTLYPSEPVLSCAASVLLHSQKSQWHQNTNLVYALEELYKVMKGGLVELANKGEPVSRIMYLVAKDLCVRTPGSKLWVDPNFRRSHEELEDCKPLQVTEYLKFLFGETALDQDTKELFCDWYIDFSHWICMGQPITFPESDVWSRMHAWLARLWTRTGAVQCCGEQRAVDMLIPMYKLGNQPEQEPGNAGDVYTGRVSCILISNRADVDVSDVTPRDAKIPELGQPYIAIHADLRAKDKKLALSLTEDESSTRCLRVYAPGVDAETYSFLGAKKLLAVQAILRDILRLSEREGPQSSISFLKAQMQYGHSVDDEHTKWELGRRA